jgi:nucleoside 2-deoxyribosyltransferase
MPFMKHVYFAAPLFTQAEWLWNEQLAKKMMELDLEVHLPQARALPMLTGEEKFDPETLFHDNIKEIEKSDLILAVMDQADSDSGTCWECGYAYKAGVPIVGLRSDLRKAGDDPSGVNLMLRYCCKEFLLVPYEKRSDIDWVAQQISELIKRLG